MLQLENSILRMIARSAPLQETGSTLCQAVQNKLSGVVCSIMQVDRSGAMRVLAAPALPTAFVTLMEGTMIGPEVGSSGTAAYLRAPIGIDDLEQDPKCARYRDILLPLGLKASWSCPVFDGSGSVTGVIALYFSEIRGPSPLEFELVKIAIGLCELAFLRHAQIADRERRAMVDGLTGLPNRAAFDVALANMPCDAPGAWGLFIIDLDHLKVVNDTFGHRAGDEYIAAAATRIAQACAPDVTFRLGGDEFAVLIQNHDALADLDATATRIFGVLETPLICDGQSLLPNATIGGAVVEPGETSTTEIYQNADFALYHAKETRRGGFVRFWPGIGTRIAHRRSAISELSAALQDDRLEAYYQPVVELDSRRIIGVEALCRIRTPAGRVVPARAFREATSDFRAATALTSRMFSIIARDARQWLDAGLELDRVSVNIVAADFRAGDLLDKLEASFGSAGISPDMLILEVSEQIFVGLRDGAVVKAIGELRQRGFRVALDAFGGNHASLTNLLAAPISGIKIDRSLITRLHTGDRSVAIVEGVIEIARKLDIRVVAEGIETEEQTRQLLSMGCPFGQGFAFSKAADRLATAVLLRGGTIEQPSKSGDVNVERVDRCVIASIASA